MRLRWLMLLWRVDAGPGVLILAFFLVCCCFYALSFIVCVWIFCLGVYLCRMCVPGACGRQKRTSDPLGLESLGLESHMTIWVMGTEPRSSGVAWHSNMETRLCLCLFRKRTRSQVAPDLMPPPGHLRLLEKWDTGRLKTNSLKDIPRGRPR